MSECDDVLALMAQGATIITPNNRLSNHLLARFARNHPTAVLEKPRCLPYTSYVQDIWRTVCAERVGAPILLNAAQWHFLWAGVVRDESGDCLDQGLIEEVQEAWRRCQLWQLDWHDPAFAMTLQTRLFQRWAEHLQTRLQQDGLIVSEQLIDYFLDQACPVEPGTIVWYCFDDYTPQQRRWQAYLTQQGCTLQYLDLPDQNGHSRLYEAGDGDEERQQLLLWLQEQIAQGAQRIAVVVPDLQAQEQGLQRLLQQHLPASLFDISLGQALNRFPLVSHALSWLSLGTASISNQQARLLLSSPYLGESDSDMLTRAGILQNSRLLQEQRIDYSLFLAELTREAPGLAQRLHSLEAYPADASIGQWRALFIKRLHQLGFPGSCPLNSHTWQCYQRFLTLLDDMRQLNLVADTNLTARQALDALNALAQHTVFQAQKTEASIQILGLLEASGCLFDRLWMMGVTDECLPQKQRLSAFIPAALQREHAMPHACPDRELSLAATILTRLQHSSPQTVFSYPRLSKDKPNLPSPLVRTLPAYRALQTAQTSTSTELECLPEIWQLPLRDNETATGHATLLADQAKCPFRAFAAHRLQARKGMGLSDGPNDAERGNIIHKVMELLWRGLGSQQHLKTISDAELDARIDEAIEQALIPYQQARPYSFPPLMQDVERERLRRLVQACLDWERQRPDFTVSALEQSFSLELAGITFHLRLDRLDALNDDKCWVIDYKSSLPGGSPWNDERPKEPQLLLYALLDDRINTLLYAELKRGHMTCKGVSASDPGLPGITVANEETAWAEWRDQWRATLHDLATEYHQGYCLPQPQNPSICQQCDYQSLCRYGQTGSE